MATDIQVVDRIPRMARRQAADPHLRLEGAVSRERSLQPADLDGLPRIEFTGGMTCNEAGRKPDRHWTGIPLRALMKLSGADPDIRYINVSSGPYGAAVGIDRADDVLLADLVDGAPITVEQGGPWRLIIPEGRNYDSVKWVDTIEFSRDTPNLASERISQARTRAREKRASST